MQITASQLNQVAELIGTTDRNIVISCAIKTLTDSGMPLNQAYDAVFGEGAYNKMAGEMCDALRAIH